MSRTSEHVNPEPDPMTIDPSNLGSVDPLSVEGIFLVALGKKGQERDEFLAASCSDPQQRERVESLLAAYENAGSFLQKPAVTSEMTPVSEYLTPCEIPGTLGRLGPYEILEEIGRGGMGVVFRAHDPKLQRIVAVKALAPELARLPIARQRFLREARAAAAISHPHVVTIFAVDGTEEAAVGAQRSSLPYLVMECIVGQTLQDKIKRVGALRVEEIVRISRQIAEGLTAAHKRGLIHRDIKPANILLENGVERVKITDFGLARTTSDGGITHTGEILGTPQCMSPEQARGEVVDQRSDLFSLGCVMYTMCTGVNPFRADNMLAVMKKVCETEPKPVAQLNPVIPEWLSQLVHQLLQKSPEQRIQTANEIVNVLECRAIVGTSKTASASANREPMKSFQLQPESMPKWLLTPILACQNSRILDVIVVSAASGMIVMSMPDGLLALPALIGFLVIWMLLLIAKWTGRGRWSWVTWPLGVVSMISLYLGMMLTVWVRMDTNSRSGIFVFGLSIGIFLLLTRWFPKWFFQTRSDQSESSALPLSAPTTDQPFESATAQPRSPWAVLGWMIVGVMGVVIFGVGLLILGVAIPAYLSKQATRVDDTNGHGVVLIEIPPGENIKTVTIDGQGVILRPGAEHQWSLHAAPGPHTLYVEFDVDSALSQVKTFKTTINVSKGMVSDVEAVPVVESRSPNNAVTIPDSSSMSPVATPGITPPADPAVGLTQEPVGLTSPPSLPLADVVDVISDVDSGPRYPFLQNSFMTSPRTHVWIDEAGLMIRFKPLDFDGSENSSDEYVPISSWGVCLLHHAGVPGQSPVDLPPGRYRVLVHDLDYAWDRDRRGTIVIGQGQQTIHVKRSFIGQQLAPSPEGASFRWAGKTYRLKNAAEMNAVNQMLAAMTGETTDAEKYGVGFAEVDFTGHPLAEQLTQPQPGPERKLKYAPRTMKLEIPMGLQIERVDIFASDQGLLSWTRSSPKEIHLPPGPLKYEVLYQPGFSWPGNGLQYELVPESLPEQTLVAQGMTKANMRKIIDDYRDQAGLHDSYLGWFEAQSISLPKHAVKAAERLVLAWLDEQPEVPEAELLQIGGVETWEKLWDNGQSGVPERNMTHLLIPGSTPGTWRLKEPPVGAILP